MLRFRFMSVPLMFIFSVSWFVLPLHCLWNKLHVPECVSSTVSYRVFDLIFQLRAWQSLWERMYRMTENMFKWSCMYVYENVYPTVITSVCRECVHVCVTANPCSTDTLPSSTERSAFCRWPLWLFGSAQSTSAFVPVHVCWSRHSHQKLQDCKNC